MPGRVIWITGLSGAGKSTVARALLPFLKNTILLDGDELRQALGVENTGFDRESRQKLALTYSRLALLLASQGFDVIVATISLYHNVHEFNRANLPGYLEIFMDIPEEIRRERDPKGLYAAERKGQIKDLAGGETQVEFPRNPHLLFSHENSLQEIVNRILEKLAQ